MKKLSLLAIMLFGTVSAWCQRSDTIYQVLMNNTVTLGPSATVRNIGQSNHVLNVVASSHAPGTCTAASAPNIAVSLEGSFDQANWLSMGVPITFTRRVITAGTFVGSSYFFGAFPFVRANLLIADVVNCQYTVAYSGSLSGAFTSDAGSAQFLNFTPTGVATIAGASQSLSTATTGLRSVLYSLVLTIPPGLTLASARLNSTTAAAVTYWIGTLVAPALGTSLTYNLPFTGLPYVVSDVGDDILLLSTAGCVGCSVTALIRYE